MLRLILGVIAGIATWMVVVALVNLGLRFGWPDYAAAEPALAFTLPMMISRLAMSGVASLAGGFVAARIGKHDWAPLTSGVILLLLFLPVHYMLWDKLPAWYHLTFLISLPLLGWLGGKLADRATAPAPTA